MRQPRWAGGAKLTWADVKRLRARKRFTRDDAWREGERLGVHHETLWRAYTGKSWATVRFQRLPDEYKRCVVCRAKYERRFAGGRHRSDAFWAQKETCSYSCSVKLRWRRGVYGAQR